jgi:hypothetical protein
MIQLDPGARLSAREYLDKCAAATVPSYFAYLHEFFGRLVPLDADTRIAVTQDSFLELCRKILSEKPVDASQGDLLRLGGIDGGATPSGGATLPATLAEAVSGAERTSEFPRSKSLPQEPRTSSAAISIDTGQLIADISNILGSPNKSPAGTPPKERDSEEHVGGASPRQLWPRSVSLGGARGGRFSSARAAGPASQKRGGAGPAASIMGRDGAFIVDDRPEWKVLGERPETGLQAVSRMKATAADAQRAAALAIGEVVTEEVGLGRLADVWKVCWKGLDVLDIKLLVLGFSWDVGRATLHV